jgi:hypothetical protein
MYADNGSPPSKSCAMRAEDDSHHSSPCAIVFGLGGDSFDPCAVLVEPRPRVAEAWAILPSYGALAEEPPATRSPPCATRREPCP